MKRSAGVTLMEMMLVLAIAGMSFIVGMRMYYTFKIDSDAAQVKANVDAIFNALGDYYRINCYGTTYNNVVTAGALNPASGATSPLPINIQTSLINTRLFTSQLASNQLPRSPLVNASGSGTNGYVAQFNRVIYTSATNTARVVSWQAQVAVQLDPSISANSRVYLGLLAGDCLSTLSGSTVLPCNASGNVGTFVVFERTIANVSKRGGSTYWGTMPTLTQFTRMYNTNSTVGSTSGMSATQYFMCGN